MFSGLPCKTHIAHIAHIARTRRRVEVQRVGVHIAHVAHIAWSLGFLGQLPVQRGELVAQVCRDHEVPVVPRQLPRGALGGPAHRLGVLVLQRFHGGLPGEDVHHHQAAPYFVFPRVFWLKSTRSACSLLLGPSAADLPSAAVALAPAGPRRPSAP